MNKKFTNVFFDTETTGLEIPDKIFELAFSYEEQPKNNYGSNFFHKKTRISSSERFNPGLDISIEASITTDTKTSDVENKPDFKNTKSFKDLNNLVSREDTIFIAYNAPFDLNMLEKEDIFIENEKVIDLYRVAKHLFKKDTIKDRNGEQKPLANNKLQYFRFLLKFDEQEDFKKLLKDYGLDQVFAHQALSDVIILEYFFLYIQRKFKLSIEEMLELSKTPVLEPFITFGNVFEKGTPFEECFTATYEQYGKNKKGYDYLDWCSNNLTLSVDTEHSLKIYFYNLLTEDKIFYNKKFERYLNYGLVFDNEAKSIDKALKLLGKDQSFKDVVVSKFHSSMTKSYEANKDKELGDKFPFLFIKRYIEYTQKIK